MLTVIFNLLVFLLVMFGLLFWLIVFIGRKLNANFPTIGTLVEMLLRFLTK